MALFSTSLWAATETIKTSGNNTAYNGTCVSVAGTYIAGGVSSGYSKLRTNQESNTITLAVKSGYKILGFSIQAYSNNSDAAKTISMTSLSYDGGANVLTEDVVVPRTKIPSLVKGIKEIFNKY